MRLGFRFCFIIVSRVPRSAVSGWPSLLFWEPDPSRSVRFGGVGRIPQISTRIPGPPAARPADVRPSLISIPACHVFQNAADYRET